MTPAHEMPERVATSIAELERLEEDVRAALERDDMPVVREIAERIITGKEKLADVVKAEAVASVTADMPRALRRRAKAQIARSLAPLRHRMRKDAMMLRQSIETGAGKIEGIAAGFHAELDAIFGDLT